MRRIASLDIVRGAVMVLGHRSRARSMPAAGGRTGVRVLRALVTHFCAPVFVFLAGIAVYLYAQKVQSRPQLAKFLVIRGLWLVLFELTLLRFAWTFNFDYAIFIFVGVIWVIGWSMVILAGLAFLPTAVVGAIGVIVIVAHNALAPVLSKSTILYGGWQLPIGRLNLVVLYTIIPWFAVMAAGYAFGAIVDKRRVVVTIGIVAIALFVVLRATGLYGDPRVWESGALQFLNTSKYPASLQFLLMTLGPMLVVGFWSAEATPPLFNPPPRRDACDGKAEALPPHPHSKCSAAYRPSGHVPHIPLIHLVAVLISFVRTSQHTQWLFANHPMLPPDVPSRYQWPLWLLYLVTALVVTTLYFPCRWYARVKAERPRAWMQYI
jgi:uncharacterized membrane protein